MIGRTLGLYFGKRYLKALLGVIGVLFVLIFVLDFAEAMRRASDNPLATMGEVAKMSLFRTPSIIEQALPFAVLFGSMICFLELARRLELVVARAAGMSVWQFLMPPAVVALALGIVASIAFNPLAASLMARSDAIQAKISRNDSGQPRVRTLWLSQQSADGRAIIDANSHQEGSQSLENVTFFLFDREGRFVRRLEASSATLGTGEWQLSDVRVFVPDQQVTRLDSLALPTSLTPSQLQQNLAPDADAVSFWRLPAAIAQALAAGLDANQYRLQYQVLLARPILLLAMVLIAATVSLRFARFGGAGKLILGGIGSGFVLYVITKIASDLGKAGLANTAAAAWTPAVIGMLIGITVLLNQEDG